MISNQTSLSPEDKMDDLTFIKSPFVTHYEPETKNRFDARHLSSIIFANRFQKMLISSHYNRLIYF